MALDRCVSRASAPLSIWILAFGSLLLINLDIRKSLPPRGASLLFRDAMHMLCNLITMRLQILYSECTDSGYSLNDKHLASADRDWNPSTKGTDYIHYYLTTVTSIQNLTSSCFLLFHYLLELGGLPHLETLRISMAEDVSPLLADLSQDAFSALRTLSFTNIMLDQADTIWQILPLVDALTTVEIVFEQHGPDSLPQLETGTSTFFHLLSVSSPDITHLTVNFCVVNQDDIGPYSAHIIDIEVFTLLGHLPLQELFLDAARCEHPNTCSLLATSFPHIRVLRLPSQPVQCRDIGLFADNLNLEWLSLQADFEDIPNLEIARREQQQPQQVVTTLEVDPSRLDCSEVRRFVMYVQCRGFRKIGLQHALNK